jgi:uncharacterized protein YjbI with pentapeptide repeats
MAKIFMSYRRGDSTVIATRIGEWLRYHYGAEQIQDDIGYVSTRTTATAYIATIVDELNVLIVVVGPTWLERRRRSGETRRIDDPSDVVRLLVELSLNKKVPILPVLVRGASMPSRSDLPAEIGSFADVEPLRFRADENHRGDMRRLYARIEPFLKRAGVPSEPPVHEAFVDADPAREIEARLEAAFLRNKNEGRDPFYGIQFANWGELRWMLTQHPPTRGLATQKRNLKGIQLAGVNLSGVDLSHTDFTGADLRSAILKGTNLDEADLTSTRLILANLEGAQLIRATFTNADLTNAVLTRANMDGADLGEAKLGNADMSQAQLANAQLQQLDLRTVRLSGAQMTNAFLSEVNARDCDLSGADLSAAHLTGAHLEGANLSRANLSNAILTGAGLSRAILTRANVDGAIFSSLDVLDEFITGKRTKDADLSRAAWGESAAKSPQDAQNAEEQIAAWQDQVRVNNLIADSLRKRGMLVEAAAYRLQAQRAQRHILWRSRKYFAWLFSGALNVLSGYGERPLRAFVAYLIVIAGFAGLNFVLTNFVISGEVPLEIGQSLLLSFAAFHGSGLLPASMSLTNQLSGVAALESLVGLIIEVIFIATFTRRFLAP